MGALTAFFAATVGVVQNDLKRVIAYSTCSQLGYMVFAVGLSNYSVSFYHLVNHAFFKALLFLSAGVVIHALADEQDMRRMGGLVRLLPFTYVMMLIGSLSLIGFPFLSGFYSKDMILELTYAAYKWEGNFAYFLGTVAAFFTAFYSFRLIYLTFLIKPNAPKPHMLAAHDASFIMGLPLALLAIPSIFSGYFLKDMFTGMGTPFWGNAFFNLPNVVMLEAEFLPAYIKLIPVGFSLIGATLALLVYSRYANWVFFYQLKYRDIYFFVMKKWYFDLILLNLVVPPFFFFAYEYSYKLIDRGILELLGPEGLSKLISRQAELIGKLQSGHISHYVLIMVVGVMSFFSIFLLGITDYVLLFILLVYLPFALKLFNK